MRDEHGGVDEVKRAFETCLTECEARVRRIVRLGRVPDPDEVVGRTLEQAWLDFLEKYPEEQAALAAGKESQHNFPARFCAIARNRLIDYKRELGVSPRRRKSRAKHVAEATAQAAEMAQANAEGRRKEVQLKYASSVPAAEEADPAVLLERAYDDARLRRLLKRAMDELAAAEPLQFLAIQTSLDDLKDAEAEEVMGMNRFAIYRLRQNGVLWLRRFFAAQGYRVATTRPRTSL